MRRISNIYQSYQSRMEAKEPFNEDLIRFKEKERPEEVIANICRGIEIVSGFEFISSEISTKRRVYNPYKERKKIEPKRRGKSKYDEFIKYPIELSRNITIEVKYRLTDKKDSVEKTTYINYPELIKGQSYLINNNRFFPVFQLTDAEFYRANGEKIVLKTMFMPLALRGILTNLKDDLGYINEGRGYNTRNIEVSLFKKNIPIFNYMFASKGLYETLEFMGVNNYINVHTSEDFDLDNYDFDLENQYYFRMNKHALMEVDRIWLDKNPRVNGSVVLAITEVFKGSKMNSIQIKDKKYWFRRLGGKFTNNTTNAEDKANATTLSLERILDGNSKANLRIPDEDKEDVYTIMRFMMFKFNEINRMDNHNLTHKRIRVVEYLLYGLTSKISKSVYRLVGTNPTIGNLSTIFSNIGKDFITSSIPKVDLVRYSNNSSTIDLFASSLKGSKGGPQSQSASGQSVSIAIKGINPSYVGCLDTTSTSSNDPGTTFTVVPFCEVFDPNKNGKFFFTEKPDIENFSDKIDSNQTETHIIDFEDIE